MFDCFATGLATKKINTSGLSFRFFNNFPSHKLNINV